MEEQEILKENKNEENRLKIEKIEKYDSLIKGFEKETAIFSFAFGISFLATIAMTPDAISFFKGDYRKIGYFFTCFLMGMSTGVNIALIADSVSKKNHFLYKKKVLESELEEEKILKK